MPPFQAQTIPSLVLALLAAGIWNLADANPLPGDQLMLSLSSSPQADQSKQSSAAVNSKLMEQIMNDEFGDDFAVSLPLLNQLKATLEQFAQQIKASAGGLEPSGAPISSWLAARAGQSGKAYMAGELDKVYQTFWNDFGPLIESIVTVRPQNLSPESMDFRCKKVAELQRLKALASASEFYSLYLDTFFSELHQHCLLRKLAMIRYSNMVPSPLVRQFVDVYLDLPTKDLTAAASKELRDQVAGQLLAGQAMNFNQEQAFARYGSLEQVADLTSLSMGSMDSSGAKKVVDQFKRDCAEHVNRLSSIWAD